MPSPFFNIPDNQYQPCVTIVNEAIAQWKNLVVTVAAENVAMGITQRGKTKAVADALMNVMNYGATGSLWQAYNELNNIPVTPDLYPFISEARIEWMKNEIIQIISSL